MNTCDPQDLLLLEFLIDKINIPSVKADVSEPEGVSTCVEFQVKS